MKRSLWVMKCNSETRKHKYSLKEKSFIGNHCTQLGDVKTGKQLVKN